MRWIDRVNFCPLNPKQAYKDCPQSIGYNVTISDPTMHALCIEWLKNVLKPGGRVLDVGSGSGYLCAAFYEIMDRQGTVLGIEHIQELLDQSLININIQ